MSALPPVTLLYGDDEFAIAEQVKELKSALGADENAAMNVTEFEARGLSFAQFRSVCESAPFLCPQRLVILADLLARGKNGAQPGDAPKDLLTALIEYLPALPAFTALLLLEHRKIPKNSRLLNAVRAMEGAEVRECALPEHRDLPRWIRARAGRADGDFSAAGAQELAAAGVDNPRALQSEIEKLLAYVNWERPVMAEDVRRMVPAAGQADVFRLVDSLGERDSRRAMAQLHRLLGSGDRDAMGVFGMVVRQYRLLLQTKEILELGGSSADVKARLGLPRFVAEKISAQSRRYSVGALERIYRRLLAMDMKMKSGGDSEVVLDVMVAGLTVWSA